MHQWYLNHTNKLSSKANSWFVLFSEDNEKVKTQSLLSHYQQTIKQITITTVFTRASKKKKKKCFAISTNNPDAEVESNVSLHPYIKCKFRHRNVVMLPRSNHGVHQISLWKEKLNKYPGHNLFLKHPFYGFSTLFVQDIYFEEFIFILFKYWIAKIISFSMSVWYCFSQSIWEK